MRADQFLLPSLFVHICHNLHALMPLIKSRPFLSGYVAERAEHRTPSRYFLPGALPYENERIPKKNGRRAKDWGGGCNALDFSIMVP